VIPSEAEATIDIRAIPGEDITQLFDELRKVIGDPAVKIEPTRFGVRPDTLPSGLDTEMFRALSQTTKRMYPGAIVLPSLSTGATDMAFLRAKGVQSYGIGPASTEQDGRDFGAHSDVERMLEASVYKFVEFVWSAVTEVAAAK
jgi:acetylornithine deacetylase/succinyl-diaminopimelate desuccinylase-like protein